MVAEGVHAILIKVACLGLTPAAHLGKSLAELKQHLMRLEETYGCNACGEGGEFETLTLDCPAFSLGHIELQARSPLHCFLGVCAALLIRRTGSAHQALSCLRPSFARQCTRTTATAKVPAGLQSCPCQ